MIANATRQDEPDQGVPAIIGRSEAIRRAVQLIQRFAPTRLPILLVGATGTGKDLFARYIHTLSGRRGELVDVNCGALPRDMVESLLFGHRRGAFAGAVADAAGLVTQASGGTLFLDELCSLGSEAQVKLLRVLENGQVRALGDTSNVAVEFRLVAAVQEELGVRIESGTFRHDLYHRIAGAVVHLPPLRERPEDVIVLAEHFAARLRRGVAPAAMPLLERHHWPGNVRELRMVIERATMLTDGDVLEAGVVAEALDQGSFPARPVLWTAEQEPVARQALLSVCTASGWDALRICETLGVSRATLYRRLKDTGISLRLSGPHRRTGKPTAVSTISPVSEQG